MYCEYLNFKGNQTRDMSRGVTDVNYNALNLPRRVEFDGGGHIEYLYSATGTKLAEKVYDADGTLIARRDYVGQFEFVADTLERTLLPEGFITEADGTFHAFIPDHQGNIAGVYNSATDSLEQFTDYYPYGLPHASATSPEANRRKYGAKELTTDHGLNLYDFAARFQNPAFPHFTTPDPLAEKYFAISPYAYCATDPINRIDPSGLTTFYVDSCGYVVNVIKNTDYDMIVLVDRDGNAKIDEDGDIVKTRKFLFGTIKDEYSYEVENNVKLDVFEVVNNEDALYLFEFFSNNICIPDHAIEFCLFRTKDKNDNDRGFIFTTHQINTVTGIGYLFFYHSLHNNVFHNWYHCHDKEKFPSNADYQAASFINKHNSLKLPIPAFIYVSESREYIQFK